MFILLCSNILKKQCGGDKKTFLLVQKFFLVEKNKEVMTFRHRSRYFFCERQTELTCWCPGTKLIQAIKFIFKSVIQLPVFIANAIQNVRLWINSQLIVIHNFSNATFISCVIANSGPFNVKLTIV